MKRAIRAGARIPPASLDRLEEYFRLLARWNARINLTALPLREPTDEAFDRLLIEPLAAAQCIKNSSAAWLDVGSGGGSPAIPLKIAKPNLRLIMVESKVRKAVFLREAIRTLSLPGTAVENARFEDVAKNGALIGSVGLVTARAVKVDAGFFEMAARLLGDQGQLLLFGFRAHPGISLGFSSPQVVTLTESPNANLAVFRRCSTWNKAIDR